MKVLWPLPSPFPSALGMGQPSAVSGTSSTSSQALLSLCLSIYSSGCVRKTSKRLVKNEIVLPKSFDVEEV